MFNQKLHSLQTHQHISFRFGQKKRNNRKENVFQMLKMYTMHSTQLNAIIWLDATHTFVTLPSSFCISHYTKKRNSFSYPYRLIHSTRFIPRIQHSNTEVSCERNFCRMLELMFKLKAEERESRITTKTCCWRLGCYSK